MLVLRKVAQASTGDWKEGSFDRWWPLPNQQEKQVPSWAATSLELRKELLEKFSKSNPKKK